MISFFDALHEIDKAVSSKVLASEDVDVMDSVGRVLVTDIFSTLDIQPFDNSAMDGFAVKLSDLATATKDNPVTLKKAGVVGAAHCKESSSLAARTCMHVMTGAVLPEGAEAVVPIENVVIDGEAVRFFGCPQPEAHIRRRGEDFKAGQCVLTAGTRIGAAHILPLTTLGIARLCVVCRPRVLFISTGAELVTDLEAPLQTGQIYNSNSYYAQAYLASSGAVVDVIAVVEDDPQQFFNIVISAQEKPYDVIVSSGAVSAGAFDYIRSELEKAEAEILYHKIALKPGKPNLLARLSSGQVYFGLPGNPVATAVGLRFFVRRALATMMGEETEKPMVACITHDFEKKAPLHMVLKGHMTVSENGKVEVTMLDGQESFMVRPFLQMNCWIFMPHDVARVFSGDMVEVYPL